MSFSSLILTGFSGVGKDTLAKLLSEEFPNVYNAKFSSLTKDLLASVMGVDRGLLDGNDRNNYLPGAKKPLTPWRECPIVGFNVTPLDLLVSLFHGAQHTPLFNANVKYTLENIPKDSFPVFTDIRRMEEYQAVVNSGWNPYVIHVYSPFVREGKADADICDIPTHHSLLRQEGLPNATYLKLKQHLFTADIVRSECKLVLGGTN